ncbi:MAG: site-specific DNA-methyltransferase [Thermodesulfobacteriota bacterium]
MIWDGKPGCGHDWSEAIKRNSSGGSTTNPGLQKAGVHKFSAMTGMCRRCGAWRGELGLEPNPGLYIGHLCSVFDEVWRVLKKTGTCWVVMGDTYASIGRSGRKESPGVGAKQAMRPISRDIIWKAGGGSNFKWELPDNVQQKSLCQIPSRFAIEMVARRWLLRNEIVWFKPNSLPSSAKDRFTVDFEKLFFFTKSNRYFFEQQFEPLSGITLTDRRLGKERFEHGGRRMFRDKQTGGRELGSSFWYANLAGRNKRCVWRIPTQPYPGAHFAVFPEALAETPIRAGSPERGIVLDPFAGSGTSCRVASKLGRCFIGIDASRAYCRMARERLKNEGFP